MNKNDTLECYTCGKEISYNEKAVIRSEFIFCTQKCCDAFFRCEYCGEQLDTKYAISEEGIFSRKFIFCDDACMEAFYTETNEKKLDEDSEYEIQRDEK